MKSRYGTQCNPLTCRDKAGEYARKRFLFEGKEKIMLKTE